MVYFIGYLVWLCSVGYRWPVAAIELLTGWVVGVVGFVLMDQRFPAFDRTTVKQRRLWFSAIVLVGLLIIFSFVTLEYRDVY